MRGQTSTLEKLLKQAQTYNVLLIKQVQDNVINLAKLDVKVPKKITS